MRERYDKYGEDGLKRGFQPPSASGAGYAPGHQGYGHSDQGGYAFRFKSANDIFSEFFGGRDPFASMFMESVFADPFADPFFSQHTGSAGLRAAAEHMPIERERRPYAGSGGGMTTTTTSQSVGAGFGFPSMFGGGGFPSMMFSSQFGSSNMPAAGSFSFVSSSTVGGEGGLRGAAGPSTRTSIQIINGAKIQTVEENDGRGNVTVTKISPDGSKEVSVNGVPQNTGAKRESPKKAVEGAGRQSYAQSRPSAQAHQPPPPQPAPAAAAANASVHASASRGGKKHESSDDESVVDIEVVELSDSSEEEALPPKRQVPLPRHEQRPTHHSTAETAKTPEHKAPSSSALEPSTKRRDADMRKDKPAAASTNEFYTATTATTHQPPAQHAPAASVPPLRPAHVTREPPAAQSSTRSSTYQPAAAAPRNEAEDMLTQARSRLKTAGGAAQSSAAPQPQHQQPISPSSHSSGGFKDILKATGASLLKSRPKMNRSSSASKAGPQPQSMQPAGGRAHGPIHRPGPLGALQPQVMSAAEHKRGAYGGQQHPYEPSISSGYASYNGAGGAVRSS
ncbi:DnaJ sub B member 6, partial [Coemansia sp. RSA 2320]